ncbi:MAG TPA: DUF4350 domain-containing protein [Thermoanaerobaculia bacterium]
MPGGTLALGFAAWASLVIWTSLAVGREGQPRPPAADLQAADTLGIPAVREPAYALGKGPVVLIDEAHGNYHTAKGRYRPFAELLARDGYVVGRQRAMLSATALDPGTILVIANALAPRNQDDWSLPTPSAFDPEEVAAIHQWVEEGGSLLLIADHMPFGGAAEALAAAFGVRMTNGYAMDSTLRNGIFLFQRADGSLADHPITRGRNRMEAIDSLRAYSGQAMWVAGAEATPILKLAPSTVLRLPVKSEEMGERTPQISAAGMLQGVLLRPGKGRLAVFGEAAMFSAQTAGPLRFGFNDPASPQNAQFVLNTLHWLSGLLPDASESHGGGGARSKNAIK